jgi:predicted nucleic acid-binding protein
LFQALNDMADVAVLDSCVFNKLFLDEHDSGAATEFLAYARNHKMRLAAPSLFLYEVLAVAAASPFGAGAAHLLVSKFRQSGFDIIEPEDSVVRRAIVIANSGHPKSGYPTFYDSAYHALALELGGTFLTSDQRHIAKAASHGGVVALRDWKSHFVK